jgi:hypothetical protein
LCPDPSEFDTSNTEDYIRPYIKPVYFGIIATDQFLEVIPKFLIYGLDKQWLIENQDVMNLNHQELYDVVHSEGGAVVQAHPYRD